MKLSLLLCLFAWLHSDEASVEEAIKKTVSHFGGIDICTLLLTMWQRCLLESLDGDDLCCVQW